MARRSTKSKGKQNNKSRQWRRIDLHIHTPGSNDYQEEGVNYLDILRQAVMRGLDVIAITDHNSVAGYAAMKKEIEQLFWLEDLGRIEPDEQRRLDEYRRLFEKILVLPGFEFTATFGFHILGIFPPETDVSFLEYLLLTLEVPAELLHEGSSAVGATSDVLKAYRVINEAGGLVIAAHANSKNGVAMRGLDFGGQTRIAYTQDPNLHVLEVTDLEKRGRYTTRRFFDGSKPEYSRAMRCIQGSDAHRLTRESNSNKNLGIGDRVTEVLLEETNFEELTAVLKGKDFSLTRPYHGPANPVDFIQLAREEGESIVQAFHESTAQRGGHLDRILRDVCAMANTNGGTIYLGASDDPKNQAVGVRDADGVIERIYTAISNRFSPEPDVQIDSLSSQGKKIVRLTIQPGNNIPYAIDHNHFYVRDEAETSLAVREEIVRLVERGLLQRDNETTETPVVAKQESKQSSSDGSGDSNGRNKSKIGPPRTGVEVVSSEKRKGTIYHTLRDLRNGNLITNVSKSSARKLWHYAITQAESGLNPEGLQWHNNMAVLNVRKKGDNVWYDLALREDNQVHLYYGVTDSGLNDAWLALVGETA